LCVLVDLLRALGGEEETFCRDSPSDGEALCEEELLSKPMF